MEESKIMYNEAEQIMYKKGYYVDNMGHDDTCYELSDNSGKIVIDNLSLGQLIQLSKLL